MPYFAQEPLSYLTLPTIKNAYKSFSIKINFRPDNIDGKEADCFTFFLVVYFVCPLSSCIISLRLISLSSLLSSFSHPHGGKVSYCMPVSLSS